MLRPSCSSCLKDSGGARHRLHACAAWLDGLSRTCGGCMRVLGLCTYRKHMPRPSRCALHDAPCATAGCHQHDRARRAWARSCTRRRRRRWR